MSPVTHLLIIASYAVAAGLIAFVLPQSVRGVEPMTAYLIGVCAFLAAALVHEILTRRTEMAELSDDLFRVVQGQADDVATVRKDNRELVEDLAATRFEVGSLRDKLEEIAGQASQAVVAEMKVLQHQLSQLQSRMGHNRPPAAESPRPAAGIIRPPLPPVATGPLDDDRILEITRTALENNRIDLYLQPIVSLPQRKIRYFEAFSRIRTEDGSVILPEHYLRLAKQRGLISVIDNLLLFRCVQLIRKTKRKNRKVGFFVNIAGHTLSDRDFFAQFIEFMEENRELSDSLIFELGQPDDSEVWDEMARAMAPLAEHGYRLSMDQVHRLDLDFDRLARQNVKYLKVSAELLLSDGRGSGARLHPSDLREALRRSHVDLIADKIESERTLVEILDFGVDYGQGFLFGEPRPSRED